MVKWYLGLVKKIIKAILRLVWQGIKWCYRTQHVNVCFGAAVMLVVLWALFLPRSFNQSIVCPASGLFGALLTLFFMGLGFAIVIDGFAPKKGGKKKTNGTP